MASGMNLGAGAGGKEDRFDIGRVAARTFGVIGRHPLLFGGVALLFSGLPTLALALAGSLAPRLGGNAGWIAPVLGSSLAYFVLASLMQTALVVATLQDLGGRRVDFGVCIRRALGMFVPLIGLSIVVGFGILAGAVLLIVPGVIVYLMWFVAVPALVEERRGILAALGRSRALTAGARWPIFGLVVAYMVLWLAIAGVSGLLGRLAPGETVVAFVNAAMTMISSLIASTGVAVAYVELRTVKEGADVDGLAAIFA